MSSKDNLAINLQEKEFSHKPCSESPTEPPPRSSDGVESVFDSLGGDVEAPSCEHQATDPSKDLTKTTSHVSTPEEEYSIFTKRQRILIVAISSFAGVISPLSATVYFPAIPSIASSLGTTIELVNLTLTTYMIFQGIAPMFISAVADTMGRKPAYIIGFTIYLIANIGLALQNNYVALMVLRCMQSSGSSGTIALTYGTVADVCPSSQRGTYMGWAGAGLMVGPALGPILGGLLSQFLGWHSIFWFLTILSAVMLIVIVVLLPETGRSVVGNGSIPPPKWSISLIAYLQLRRTRRNGALETNAAEEEARSKREETPTRKSRVPNPLAIISIVLEKDVGLLLLNNSLIYVGFFCIMSSLPQVLEELYGFNDLQIGLSYLPFGLGSALGTIINGRILDWNFRRVAKQHSFSDMKKRGNNLRGFPIEKARIQCALPLLYIGLCFYTVYGWLLHAHVNYVAPLFFLFLLSLTLNGAFTVSNTLLVDLYPQKPASATAANNLVRCLMGAGGVALISPLIKAIGIGWCFTLIVLILALASTMLWTLLKWGPGWREARHVRMDAKRESVDSGKG